MFEKGSAGEESTYIPQPVFDATKIVEQKVTETSTFHGAEQRDYLGRSFLYPPSDVALKLKGSGSVAENFIPKQLVHTWTGHTKVNLVEKGLSNNNYCRLSMLLNTFLDLLI